MGIVDGEGVTFHAGAGCGALCRGMLQVKQGRGHGVGWGWGFNRDAHGTWEPTLTPASLGGGHAASLTSPYFFRRAKRRFSTRKANVRPGLLRGVRSPGSP